MKLFVKFDINTICTKVLQTKLDELGIKYDILGFGELEILEKIDPEKYAMLIAALTPFGIEIIENEKSILVQKIKDVIVAMVHEDDSDINITSSVYLSEKLGHSYGFLSKLFSELTFTSIGKFIIIQKIEYTKQLILNTELSLSEIAYKLNYSSVAHLCTQFKNITGITPSTFQRIISKRKINTLLKN